MRAPALAFLTLALWSGWLASPASARAKGLEAELRVEPTEVQLGDHFQIIVTASAAARPTITVGPRANGVRILSERPSTSMSVENIFGRITQRHSLVTRFLCEATRTGRITIGAVTVEAGGERARTSTQVIEVRDPGPYHDPSGETRFEEFDANGFIRLSVSNAQPYVGEAVLGEVTLFLRSSAGATISRTVNADGFWVEDLLDATRLPPPKRVTVRGTTFEAHVIRRFVAYGLAPGDYTWSSARVMSRRGRSFGFRRGPPVVYEGTPGRLTVRPLPAGVPEGAHVGTLEASGELEERSVEVGEGATLRLTLRGEGYVRGLALEPPTIDGLRVLEAGRNDETTDVQGALHTTRTLELVFIPQRPGTYTIPAWRFPTFAADEGTAAERTVGPFTLTATAGTSAPATSASSAGSTDAEATPDERAADVNPWPALRLEATLDAAPAHAARDARYWSALVGILALPLLVSLFGRLRSRRAKRGPAPPSARAESKRALELAERVAAGEPDALQPFGAALRDLVARVIGRSVGADTHAAIAAALREAGAAPALAQGVETALAHVDAARYAGALAAPVGLTETVRELARFAEEAAS